MFFKCTTIKGKKSQVSLFIIIGIILLAIVILIYYIQTKQAGKAEIEEVPMWIQPIKSFVELCSQQETENGLAYIGVRGGYYNPPDNALDLGFFSYPYYFYEGEPFFQQREAIEKELSGVVEVLLDDCLNNFSIFLEQGFEILQNDLNVEIQFTNEDTLVKIHLPLEVKKGESSTKIEDFSSSVDFNFDKLYSILSNIKDVQMKYPDYVPVEPLTNLAKMNNFTFQAIHLPDSIVVYYLIFNNNDIYKEPYTHAYAAKYKWEDIQVALTKEVDILPIEKQEAFAGYEFTYQVRAKGDNIKFSDYTTLFDIDETGLIKFIPTNEQGGKHFVIIKAEDDNGNSDTEIFELDIQEYNQKPFIYFISTQNINADELFTYYINATDPDNDALFYLDNSDLFNININTGLINFTPEVGQKGTHKINITVVDVGGLADNRQFEMVIS